MSVILERAVVDALEQAVKAAITAGFRTFRERYFEREDRTADQSVKSPEVVSEYSDPWPQDAGSDLRPGTTVSWLLERLRPFPKDFDFADLQSIVEEYERWRPNSNSARYTINNALGFLRDRGYLEFDSAKRGRYHKRRPS